MLTGKKIAGQASAGKFFSGVRSVGNSWNYFYAVSSANHLDVSKLSVELTGNKPNILLIDADETGSIDQLWELNMSADRIITFSTKSMVNSVDYANFINNISDTAPISLVSNAINTIKTQAEQSKSEISVFAVETGEKTRRLHDTL